MTKILLKKLKIENFKGIREKTIDCRKLTTIKGKNGAGKTTVLTAWLWLICNKDSFLASNPAIFPIDSEECTPTVTAELDVNGTPVTIVKSQKRKVSKPNEEGVSKVSTTNNYEFNSVEVAERDFYKKLEEKGIDPSIFAITSHTDAFLSLKAEEKRNILISSNPSFSGDELVKKAAKSGVKLPILSTKIKDYNLEEIKSMAKATIRKIREVYGKDGELLNAQIAGLNMSVKSISVPKEEVLAKIEKISEKRKEVQAKDNEAREKYAETARLLKSESEDATSLLRTKMDKYNRLVAASEKGIIEKTSKLKDGINELERAIIEQNHKVTELKNNLNSINSSIANMKETVRQINNRGSIEVLCPTCGQPLPVEKANAIREASEAQKKATLVSIESEASRAEEIKIDIENLEREINSKIISKESYLSELYQVENEKVEPTKEIEEILEEVKKLEVLAKEKMESYSSHLKTPVKSYGAEIISELDDENLECNKILSDYDFNDEINGKIAALRAKQVEYEQAKAEAESVIDELDRLSKFTNQLITEEINKKFSIVEWKFFDYKKNGEYTEVCDAYVDGKKLGESANTGRELIAKIDIAASLQKIFNQKVPLFVDGFECLSSESVNRLKGIDNQLITLVVSEDEELTLC